MRTFYRSVWISDVHLCSRDSQPELLCSFLDSIKCDYLYLVGDIVDVWALRRKWYWPKQYNEIIHKLLKRSRKGARVLYIPGNHDEFFRNYVGVRFGELTVVSHSYHETADHRRFLVIHGDEFDTVVRHRKWLSLLASHAYRYLISVNRAVNAIHRFLGYPHWSFAAAVKGRVKTAVKHLSNFEDLVTKEAVRRGVDGVVCGHTHEPGVGSRNGVLYYNAGDWTENCTALVEDEQGEVSLIYWRDEIMKAARPEEGVRAVPHHPLPVSSLSKPRDSFDRRRVRIGCS